LCLAPKFYPSLIMVRRQERSIISPEGRLTWTRAWKTAFASAPMRSGPRVAACTAKPSSTGLRPKGKCWRHRRPCSPANQLRRRNHGRPHVPPPERSRGPADAVHRARHAAWLLAARAQQQRVRPTAGACASKSQISQLFFAIIGQPPSASGRKACRPGTVLRSL